MTRVIARMGLGSRYSWLAASRLAEIAAAPGAVFDWQPLASGTLIARARGGSPVAPCAVVAKAPAWRDQDAARWADLCGIACPPPQLEGIAPEAMARTAGCFDGRARGAVARAIMGVVFSGVGMTEARLRRSRRTSG